MYTTRVSRHIAAPAPVVYRLLLDPDAVAHWRVPYGMSCEVHAFEAREGGAFRISLRYAPGGDDGKSEDRADTYHGTFIELVPYERVVEKIEFETSDPRLHGTMILTTTLAAIEDGTEVRIVHEEVPDAVPAADNELGTHMALNRLAALAEGRPDPQARRE
ncbi:SRPBCC domain-containing protein [Streptomyces sp. NPDC058877]|uniref:SRPBCC domain-containing protein n=1 Tax=unclassified Streptomyces TaxID=2593676 RepID=UPI0036B3A2F4